MEVKHFAQTRISLTELGVLCVMSCEHNCGREESAQTVQCSWQENESDKMDLKSMAVRFENVEQREAIFKKFKEKGFNIVLPSNPSGVCCCKVHCRIERKGVIVIFEKLVRAGGKSNRRCSRL